MTMVKIATMDTMVFPCNIYKCHKSTSSHKTWHMHSKYYILPFSRTKVLKHSFNLCAITVWYGFSQSQGPHSHILLTGESEGFFGVWNFGQKGFFWVYEWLMGESEGFFWVWNFGQQGFLGVLYFSSAQINNNISSQFTVGVGFFWVC